MTLLEKYTPHTLSGLIGNEQQRQRLAQYGIDIIEGKRVRPLMIYGPTGVGKTAAVHALANSNAFELIELNASDYRDSEAMDKRVMPLLSNRGLFGKSMLILLDEIDELSRLDLGAEKAVMKLVKGSVHPVLLIANDYWNKKVSFLRESVDKLEFKRVDAGEIFMLLQKIADGEGKGVNKEILANIAKRSNGDVRGAINDLELMLGAEPELIDFLGLRDRKAEIFTVLDKIFFSCNFDIARNALMSTDIDMEMVQNWIAQNIPGKYLSKASVSDAYSNLSKASMFSEKASRTSYYGYLRYSSVLMSSGVSISGNGNYSRLTPYAFPARISRMSKTKKSRDVINRIASKLSPMVHASMKVVRNEHLPLLSAMINKSIEAYGAQRTQEYMEMTYKLEKDDVAAIASYSRFSA